MVVNCSNKEKSCSYIQTKTLFFIEYILLKAKRVLKNRCYHGIKRKPNKKTEKKKYRYHICPILVFKQQAWNSKLVQPYVIKPPVQNDVTSKLNGFWALGLWCDNQGIFFLTVTKSLHTQVKHKYGQVKHDHWLREKVTSDRVFMCSLRLCTACCALICWTEQKERDLRVEWDSRTPIYKAVLSINISGGNS